MPILSKLRQPHLWPLLLLAVADGLIVANAPPGLRFSAALILLMFLSGWVWLQALFDRPADPFERLMLAAGLSLALTILTAMGAVYLPGPLTAGQILIVSNAQIIAAPAIIWWRQSTRPGPETIIPSRSPILRPDIIILIGLLLLAALLRLPRLGYAEFHEDEAEALMLGVRLFQGEDYAIFLHRKGPAQMLLPVTFWLLTGHIDETLARFPFALSSMLSVATVFLIGRRWFGWPVGATAGLLWAINGFAIAFGRMAQYQAVIFFLGPLAIYCLYLVWKFHQSRLQIPAAIMLATCLLAHYDALLLLPVAGYLGWRIIRRVDESQAASAPRSFLNSRLLLSAGALILFLVLLASFYVPYLRDPEFSHTATYLAGTRIKPGLLYNKLNILLRVNKLYSSHFYLPILAVGVIGLIARRSFNHQPAWRWILAGLGLLATTTLWLPEGWQIGPSSLAVLPWLGLLLICFRLFSETEFRAAWLMFGAGFIGYVFLVDDPRTHVYIMYPGLVLLAGAGWVVLVNGSRGHTPVGERTISSGSLSVSLRRSLIPAAGLILVAATMIHTTMIFLQTESGLERARDWWDGSFWEATFDELPKERTYFGYPKLEGWKAIGALKAQGLFPGDFRSVNEDFIIPIWYNYGQARSCYTTPAHYFVRSTGGKLPVAQEGYAEVGQVRREGELRLRIFSAEARPETAPVTYRLAEFTDLFDQQATPGRYRKQAEPPQPLETLFGTAIKFEGFDLSRTTVAPGEILHLDLYWQAMKPPPEGNYRAFVHLTDGTTLWGQQDDDPACRLPTSIWRAGQRGVGQFRLTIDPNTPPGRYPLIIGLYEANTLERLKITSGAGHPGDDFLWLGDIEVVSLLKRP
jgi:hypothetical protein